MIECRRWSLTGLRSNRFIAFVHARPSGWKRELREQADAAKPSVDRTILESRFLLGLADPSRYPTATEFAGNDETASIDRCRNDFRLASGELLGCRY